MLPTVPGPILIVLAVAAALIVALVTWALLKWVLHGPATLRCPECGAGMPAHGECPRCSRKVA